MSLSLALCMIVKDNSAIIERCLSSVIEYIDEAVIVDTGSDDFTPTIIHQFFHRHGKKLQLLSFTPVSHPEAFLLDVPETWKGRKIPGKFTGKHFLADFAAARQFGWEKANSDYKFWLDSDDVFEGAHHIPTILTEMQKRELDCALLNYDYSKDRNGNVNCRLIRERFVSKFSKAKWQQRVHEILLPVMKSSLFLGANGPGPNIIHKRVEDGAAHHIEYRNLKILLDWYEKNRARIESGQDFDLRMLCYLGIETRQLFPDDALIYFENYIERSKWDEERALVHTFVGEIYETRKTYRKAFAAYAQAAADFPASPDGIFGLARCAFFQQDFAKCIEFTERGLSTKADRPHLLMHDPSGRTWKPYVFYSRALYQVGRTKDALAAAEKGLSIMPDEISLKEIKQICQDNATSSPAEPISFRFDDSPDLDRPPQDIPPRILSAFALEIWKQLSLKGLHVPAQQFLDSLPDTISGSLISEARARTYRTLESLKTHSSAPSAPSAKPVARPSLEEPVVVTVMKKAAEPSSQIALPTQKSNSSVPLKITIWTGPGYESWNPENLDTVGIGGSETAAVCMARELARRGHKLTVLGHCPNKEGVFDAVEYVHYERALAAPASFACDVLVISRQVNVVDLPIPRRTTFLWVHDIHVGDPIPQHVKWFDKYDKIFCLSNWHKEFFLQTYAEIAPHLRNKIIVTRNGLDLQYFGSDPDVLPKKDGNRLIYSSSPDRGLIRLLEFLPAIKEQVPDVKLDIFYGFENWKKMVEIQGSASEKLNVVAFEESLNSLTKEGVVTYHGRVSKPKLAEAFMRAKVWAYPTWFSETSCITALEAQAAGCVPVSTALAALTETVSHGFLIRPPDSDLGYKDVFVKRVVNLLRADEEREKYARAGRKYAFLNSGWDQVAETWENHFSAEIRSPSSSIRVESRKLRFACIFGRFSSGLHGNFNVPDLFTKRAVTGSESCFFNFIRGMSERGHQVDAFCDVQSPHKADKELAGAHVYPFTQGISSNYDAFLSWNEPDLLRGVPQGKFRVCVQQLNDFMYCQPGFDQFVDLYVMPSETHRKYLSIYERLSDAKTAVIPNSINWEMFESEELKRDPYSLIWSSSPDRGLHVALRVFQRIREKHSQSTLKIFYRFAKWYDQVKDFSNETGARAREINKIFQSLGTDGENGLFLLDAQPNTKLIHELKKSRAQIYTCEPIRFTEGFGVSVMDAAAAGCVPIVSDADAIAEIHRAAIIIKGTPSNKIEEWVAAVDRVFSDESYANNLSRKNQEHAKNFDRSIICRQWEKLLMERIR